MQGQSPEVQMCPGNLSHGTWKCQRLCRSVKVSRPCCNTGHSAMQLPLTTWIGLSWLAVEVMASLPSSLISQAQPLPKRPAAAVLNLFLNSSMEPKDSSMAALSSPDGPLLPVG